MARLLNNIEQQKNLAIELNTRLMAMIGSGIRGEQVLHLCVWMHLIKLLMRGLIATGFAKRLFSNAFIDVIIHKALYQTPFTPIANATGQPAMSVPLHYWGNDGLPHGAQFMAAEGNDRLLFQLAAQLELEHPWKHKVSGICL